MNRPSTLLSSFLRTDPFLSLEDLNQLFGNTLNRSYDPSKVETGQWIPSVDIIENPQAFVLHTDLPGVKKNDIEVSMEDGVLIIRGKRENIRKETSDTIHRTERSYGEFYRKFSLPELVDAQNIQASFKEGVLELTIPKSEKVQPKRIEVKGD